MWKLYLHKHDSNPQFLKLLSIRTEASKSLACCFENQEGTHAPPRAQRNFWNSTPSYHSCYYYSLDAHPDKLVKRTFKILNLFKKHNEKEYVTGLCFFWQGLYFCVCIMICSRNHLLSGICHLALWKTPNSQWLRWG